jgi:[ribosomal protein S5]-alanine N-acetyltransferase
MDDVTLRPILETDLDELARFAMDPAAGGEFEWAGFRDPKAARRRWEEDGWLNEEHSWLAVAPGDGSFAGIVSWRQRESGAAKGGRFEVGIELLPEHRGRGIGTTAQRLLAAYLFETTAVHRLEALTDIDNLAEQRALDKVGFTREGVLREGWYRAGQWRNGVIYSLLRGELDAGDTG